MREKQALYFIAKCLTLTQFKERVNGVKQQIVSGKINWDSIVKVSSGHMVIPALYLNLKRVNLLTYLPKDLVTYFTEITQLNKKRNLALLKQVNEINTLLNKHNITPIFLKGTAHLLENLYQDIAERMIGDIDFLVEKSKIETVAKLLINKGYYPLNNKIKADKNSAKHYNRLANNNALAAVEIHWQIVNPPYKNKLDYNTIFKSKVLEADLYVPSYNIQAIHNILNTQINDKGLLYGKIMLRQLYDGYLLSFKPKVLEAYKNYPYNFYLKNTYLRLIQNLFNPNHLILKKSFLLNILMFRYKFRINFPKINKLINIVIYLFSRIYKYIRILFQAIYNKEQRNYIYIRVSNPSWYKRHIWSYIKRT